MIVDFTTLAGPDFTWSQATRDHRPPSYARAGLRLWLGEQQGGICPVCGNDVMHGEINHVVGQGKVRRGYLMGNIFLGCATCNTTCEREFGYYADGQRSGGVIPLSRFARPDLIGTAKVPGPTALKRMSQ
jgi:hypothetical protein